MAATIELLWSCQRTNGSFFDAFGSRERITRRRARMLVVLGLIWRTAGAGHDCQNQRPSFLRRKFEAAAGGGGGAVVSARSKFDPAIDDPEIEPMDEAAIATRSRKLRMRGRVHSPYEMTR